MEQISNSLVPSRLWPFHPRSAEDWEARRPIIEDLYWKCGRKLPTVMGIMKDLYNFAATYSNPTSHDEGKVTNRRHRRKQYQDQFKRWKLEKNVKTSEMEAIIRIRNRRRNNENKDTNFRVRKRPVPQQKIDRYLKRQKPPTAQGTTPDLDPSAAPTPSDMSYYTPRAQDTPTPSDTGDNLVTVPAALIEETGPGPESATQDMSTSNFTWESPDDFITSKTVISNDNALRPLGGGRQFVNWAAVDVLRSPGMFRLFEALELECCVPVPPLSLDLSDSEESQYISNEEISSLFNEENRSLVYETGERDLGRQYSMRNGARQLPSKDMRPRLCGWTVSPRTEINYFPLCQDAHTRGVRSVRVAYWSDLVSIENNLQIKLCKLQSLLPIDHPGVSITLDDLATIYWRQGRYAMAEKYTQRVADARRSTLGERNQKTLLACIQVIIFIVWRGQNHKAQTLLDVFEPVILENFDSEHELVLLSSSIRAYILCAQGRFNESEKLLRQVLQIRLRTQGPREFRTWEAMVLLSNSLLQGRHVSEGEKLACAAVQLHPEVCGVYEEDICSALRILSYALRIQSRHDLATNAAQYAVNCSERLLGLDHPLTLNSKSDLAWSLGAEGRWYALRLRKRWPILTHGP